jgi:hypothetical protein
MPRRCACSSASAISIAYRRGLIERQRSSGEARRERLALQVLHHEEAAAVVLPDIVQRPDMRVIELRDGARLALEALIALAVGDELSGQNFYGDRSVQSRVARSVHFTHAARADERADLVHAQPLACVQAGCKQTLLRVGFDVEQRLDLRPEVGIAGADVAHIGGAFVSRALERVLKYLFDAFPGRCSHLRSLCPVTNITTALEASAAAVVESLPAA